MLRIQIQSFMHVRQVLIDTESSPLLPFTFKMQKSFPKPGFPQTSETRPHLTCIHTRQKLAECLQLLPVDGTLAFTPSIVPMFPRHLSTAQTKWPMPFVVESKLLFSWPEGSIFFSIHAVPNRVPLNSQTGLSSTGNL